MELHRKGYSYDEPHIVFYSSVFAAFGLMEAGKHLRALAIYMKYLYQQQFFYNLFFFAMLLHGLFSSNVPFDYALMRNILPKLVWVFFLRAAEVVIHSV